MTVDERCREINSQLIEDQSYRIIEYYHLNGDTLTTQMEPVWNCRAAVAPRQINTPEGYSLEVSKWVNFLEATHDILKYPPDGTLVLVERTDTAEEIFCRQEANAHWNRTWLPPKEQFPDKDAFSLHLPEKMRRTKKRAEEWRKPIADIIAIRIDGTFTASQNGLFLTEPKSFPSTEPFFKYWMRKTND